MIYLEDIASIYRDYVDLPNNGSDPREGQL